MNVADLEAELPALTVTLLTGVDNVAQVSCADRRPQVRRADVHALWALESDTPLPDAGGLGRTMHSLRYTLSIFAPSATQAERRAWGEELRAGLHARRKPTNVAGLDHAEVLAYEVAPPAAPGDVPSPGVPGGVGPAVAAAAVLFVGDVEVS
jgi:hypothetical protein